jgi:hypothetical protein
MKLFSAFAAAELLERDRQTIARALRNTPPDGKEKNQPRWKMSTVVAALEKHAGASASASTTTAANPPEYAMFDQAFAALEALPTVEARRKAAIKVMPVLHTMIAALKVQGRDAGEHWQHTDLRGDAVYRVTMLGFQGPCEWSHDEVWHNLNRVGFDDKAA